jgi:hypothetical protein
MERHPHRQQSLRPSLWGLVLAVGCAAPSSPIPLVASASFSANPGNPFSVWVGVQADRDVLAVIELEEDGDRTRTTPPFALRAGEPADQLVLGLHAGVSTELHLVATEGGRRWTIPLGSYQSEPLSEDWSGCEVSSAQDLEDLDPDEAICTNGMLGQGLSIVCFDRSGQPFWSISEHGEALFRLRPLSDGSFAVTSLSSSKVLLYDASGLLTGDITTLDLQGLTRFEHSFIDPHALIEIREGPWEGALVLATVSSEQLDSGLELTGTGFVVLDRDSGEVLWDWHILGDNDGQLPLPELGDLEACSRDPNCLHANDLVHRVDEDGAQSFWLSLNGPSQVILVDVESEAVAWRLGVGGDFALVDDLDADVPTELGDESWMYNQHGLELHDHEDGRVRLFLLDNGNDRPDAAASFSRVLELEIDEIARRAAPVFEYGSDDPQDSSWFYANMCGDADLLPGGAGLMFLKGDEDVAITELSHPQGEVRWRLECPDWQGSFGLQYFPSLYETTWWYDG